MWEHKLFEFFTTFIPQSFAFILLLFTLTGIKIKKKTFLISSIGFSIITFLIRPYVNFGVHSVILLFILVAIATIWGKVNFLSSVIYSIISFIVAYLCEWTTFFFLELFNFNMEILDNDPQIRATVGFIPIILFLTVGLIVYYFKNKKKKEDESNNDIIRENF